MSAETTKAEIRSLEDRRYRAMCEGDTGTLNALLADSLIYTHSSSLVDSKASYVEGIKTKKFDYRKIERPIEDIQVHGNTAVITGQARIDVVSSGQPKQLNSRFTNVWVKGDKGWQMVAWQSTPIPG